MTGAQGTQAHGTPGTGQQAPGMQAGGTPAGAQAPGMHAVYVISVAAELAGVHPQTLRIYERKGLLAPARTTGGSRRYSEADIAQMRGIQQLTNAGINLEGVRHILTLLGEIERLRSELDRVRTEARDAIRETHNQYRRDLVPVRQAGPPAKWRG